MNLAHSLQEFALRTPSAPAIFCGEQLLHDYGQLYGRSMALAVALTDLGLTPGGHVAIWMANHPTYIEILYAIWAAGGVAVPINYKLHVREVTEILQDSGATILFTGTVSDFPPTKSVLRIGTDDAAYEAQLQGSPSQAIVKRADGDLAWLFYTSGTTGRPKGAMLSFANLRAMADAYLADVDPEASERAMLYAAPLSHGAGLYATVQTLIGGRHVIPVSRAFEPREILDLGRMAMIGPLSLFAAPTMVQRLVNEAEASGETGQGIATVVYGGGPMYVADIERATRVMGARFVQIYGQGESPMTITYLSRELVINRTHPRWRQRLGSVGVAHRCTEVRTVNAGGGAAATGEPGEILVRGPTVMQGYWKDEAATAAAFVGGWLRTGDIGFLDDDGFLTLTDRSKDIIISGGTNIYPREVEEVLLEHPDIEQASVIGAADPEWGEIVVGFVVRRPGSELSEAEIDRHCLKAMARFKRPKRYRFVDDLPKNAYGKVMKSVLRTL